MSRVLLIEDQKRLLGSLQRGLAEEGYEVVTAATGEEGTIWQPPRPRT